LALERAERGDACGFQERLSMRSGSCTGGRKEEEKQGGA